MDTEMHRRMVERARERERRMATIEEQLVEHQSALNAMDQFLEALSKEKERDESHSYKFRTADVALVSLAEIAGDVSRSNPVFEVVVQGKEYKKLHCLLIHDSLILKGSFLCKEGVATDAKANVATVLKTVERVTPTVSSLDLSNVAPLSFRDVMDALITIIDFPLHTIGAEPVTVVVRPR